MINHILPTLAAILISGSIGSHINMTKLETGMLCGGLSLIFQLLVQGN